MAIVRRDIRFVIYQSIYDHPVVSPWAADDPRRSNRGAEPAGNRALASAGHTSDCRGRTGVRFCRGTDYAHRAHAALPPRVRVCHPEAAGAHHSRNLEGAASSVFSLERGRLLWSAPRQFPCEIVVSFGRPMPADSSAVEVRQAVQELETAAYRHHKQHMRPLPHALVQNARRHPFRLLMADANTPCVSYIAALMKSIYLARRLRSCWAGQRNVGSCRLRRLAAPW